MDKRLGWCTMLLCFLLAGFLLAQEGEDNCWLQLISGNELVEGATIWIDGQKSGQMASVESGGVFIGGLTKGKHVIEIEGEIIERITKQIQITDESRVWQETVEATRATRMLRIESEPSGARIRVNGEETGIAPLEVEVAVGLSVTVEGQKEGFEPSGQNFTVDVKGEMMELVLVLVKKLEELAWLLIPNPQGQSLYVDGAFLGWEQHMQVEVTPGEHLVEVKKLGWTVQRKNVHILPGQTMEIRLLGENMVEVKGGSFQMGDTCGQGHGDEKPIHTVAFSYDFAIAQHEVTFSEFDAYCISEKEPRPKDEGWGRGRRPVINVSWKEAIAYCNWLSQRDGLAPAYNEEGQLLDIGGKETSEISRVEGYRLPTESEWEFAARGGALAKEDFSFSGSNSMDEVGWYEGNSRGKTQLVESKKANALGIFDMSGNVYEWCHDFWGNYLRDKQDNPIGPLAGPFRVIRGGSWYYFLDFSRVSARSYAAAGARDCDLGFRVAQTLVEGDEGKK